jgi:hypothetical protein
MQRHPLSTAVPSSPVWFWAAWYAGIGGNGTEVLKRRQKQVVRLSERTLHWPKRVNAD